jgi:hypothetical protein
MFKNSLTPFVIAILFAGLLAQSAHAQSDIPPPPVGEWVVDQTRTFTAEEMTSLNRLCEEIKKTHGGECVVVMIPTTNGRDYKRFASELMTKWKVGSERDDGVMIFVAKNDRTFRIVLGDGIDTPGQVQMVQSIYEREVKPEFRAGKFADGTYAAVYQTAEQILGLQRLESPSSLGVSLELGSTTTPSDSSAESTASNSVPNETTTPNRTNEIDDFPADMTTRDIDRALKEMNRAADRTAGPPARDAARFNPKQQKKSNGLGLVLLVSGGAAGLGAVTLVGGRLFLKNRTRFCMKCQSELQKLDERADDEYLEPPEKLEEHIGSMRYDVWACMTCEDVIKLRYGVFFTRYSNCPSCQRKTRSKIKRTLVMATERRGGVVEVTENCENCDYHRKYTYRTPKKPSSSSRSGGRRSGFSFGGRSGRSGGRSSGGGRSFGGGSNSGRGGGGRW